MSSQIQFQLPKNKKTKQTNKTWTQKGDSKSNTTHEERIESTQNLKTKFPESLEKQNWESKQTWEGHNDHNPPKKTTQRG